MSKQSQFFWSHKIDKPTEDVYERFSVTLRTVHHRFNKSTIIVGDSNTKYLQFGKGNGTFGFNMPGCQIYTPKLEEINPLDCAGYSNIFIHCGINNLKNHISPSTCFGILKDKIGAIQLISPGSKVVISPILPTKSAYLNQMALSFNKYLFEYVSMGASSARLQTLNFSAFCSDQGLLHESLGRYLNPNDAIHLGKIGYRLLASLIKDRVFNNKVDGRSYANVTSLNSNSANSRMINSVKGGVYRGMKRGSMNMMVKPPTASNPLPAPSQQVQS